LRSVKGEANSDSTGTVAGNFFSGFQSDDGGGLTNLSVNGLTVRISVLVLGPGINILCFANGILRAIP
jgi:hypothetical protein